MCCVSCFKDGSRSSEAVFQEKVSNHLMLLQSKAEVVSDKEKVSLRYQVRIKEVNLCEPLIKCRKSQGEIKIGCVYLFPINQLTRDMGRVNVGRV